MAANSSSIEDWPFRSLFPDASGWITDSFARDNDALTRALQISLSDDSSASETLSSAAFLRPPPAISAASPAGFPPARKIAKRKSRVSKRSPTTYINADPANFRRMVQEVTGIRFGDGPGRAEPMIGPGRVDGYLPTLDTSALLLDRAVCGSFGPVVDGPVFDFEPFPSFPTLESWGM